MKIKIISDGRPQNTKVLNADTDELLENVSAVTWNIDANNIATAHLKLVNVPVDVIGYDITGLGMKHRKYTTPIKTDNILWNFILK